MASIGIHINHTTPLKDRGLWKRKKLDGTEGYEYGDVVRLGGRLYISLVNDNVCKPDENFEGNEGVCKGGTGDFAWFRVAK